MIKKNVKVILMPGKCARYEAILKCLKVEYKMYVKFDDYGDGFTHLINSDPEYFPDKMVEALSQHKISYLCTPPIWKHIEQLEGFLKRGIDTSLIMPLLQLYHIDHIYPFGSFLRAPSCVDYYDLDIYDYNWEMFDTIAMHGGELNELTFDNKSPIYHCKVNGKYVSKDEIERAHFTLVDEWLRGSRPLNNQDILLAHKKVHQYTDFHDESNNSDTSTLDE